MEGVKGQGEGAGEAAGRLAALRSLDSAEALLAFFGIEYDAEALAPRRVRLLKRYGASVAMIDRISAPLGDEERLRLHGEALAGQWERLVLETTCASSYQATKTGKAGGCAACGAHTQRTDQAA
jgi:hypothetical protein